MRMHIITDKHRDDELAQYRLLQLVNPNLPVGAFSYSQGLEWAVENTWVSDQASLHAWLTDLLQGQMQQQELPLLAQMFRASALLELDDLDKWSQELIAFRETSELRAEEQNRGRALMQVLLSLDVLGAAEHKKILQSCQHAGFAWVCCAWGISISDCLRGFVWGWLENAVLAAIKTIPLGQSSGQSLLYQLSGVLPDVVRSALDVPEQEIGYASPAVAFASSAHETQYTRLYRS